MTLNEISKNLNIECSNDVLITGLNTLSDANENEISFLENKKYINDLKNTKAAAVFVKEEFASQVPENTVALISDEPYLKLAYASKLFAPKLFDMVGKEPIIGDNTTIMPNVYLGVNSIIGKIVPLS